MKVQDHDGAIQAARSGIATLQQVDPAKAIPPMSFLEAQLYQSLGLALDRSGDFAAARDAFSTAVRRFESLETVHENEQLHLHASALNSLAICERRLGNVDAALESYDLACATTATVLEKQPDNAAFLANAVQLYFNRANLLFQLDRFGNAADSYRTCIRLGKELDAVSPLSGSKLAMLLDAQGMLATSLARDRDFHTAKQEFETALQHASSVEPGLGVCLATARIRNNYGRMLMEDLQRPDEARQQFLEVAKICRDSLARIRIDLGFRKSLGIALNQLVELEMLTGSPEKAADYSDQRIQVVMDGIAASRRPNAMLPRLTDAMTQKGEILMHRDSPDAVIDWLRTVRCEPLNVEQEAIVRARVACNLLDRLNSPAPHDSKQRLRSTRHTNEGLEASPEFDSAQTAMAAQQLTALIKEHLSALSESNVDWSPDDEHWDPVRSTAWFQDLLAEHASR